jgi:hypothetical protein
MTAGKAQYATVGGPTKPTSITRFATFLRTVYTSSTVACYDLNSKDQAELVYASVLASQPKFLPHAEL